MFGKHLLVSGDNRLAFLEGSLYDIEGSRRVIDQLANRFNAFTYWLLSKMMDSHNVGRKRSSAEAALRQVQAKALIIGIQSDMLFPLSEQEFLAQHISNATLEVITSNYGHDGFLVEFDQLKKIITHYFNKSLSKVLV